MHKPRSYLLQKILLTFIYWLLGMVFVGCLRIASPTDGSALLRTTSGLIEITNSVTEMKTCGLSTKDGWHVAQGFEGINIGTPTEAYVRIYAIHDDKIYRVEDPQDLGELHALCITNISDAIKYVELFTKPNTYFMFKRPYALTIPPPESNLKYGELPKPIYRRLGIETVTIKEIPKAFIVTRYLLSCKKNNKEYPIIKVKELISKDGEYKILTSTEVGRVEESIVMLPIFE